MNKYFLVALALSAPGLLAYFSINFVPTPPSLSESLPFLILFLMLLVVVLLWAIYLEHANSNQLGFRYSGIWSLVKAVPITIFFVFIYGPFAYAFVSWLEVGGFEEGKNRLIELPIWYAALTILIVAGGEEWLYRGYAYRTSGKSDRQSLDSG